MKRRPRPHPKQKRHEQPFAKEGNALLDLIAGVARAMGVQDFPVEVDPAHQLQPKSALRRVAEAFGEQEAPQ